RAAAPQPTGACRESDEVLAAPPAATGGPAKQPWGDRTLTHVPISVALGVPVSEGHCACRSARKLAHAGPSLPRCALAEAYKHTAAAAARLRLSARPYRGTRTRESARSARS